MIQRMIRAARLDNLVYQELRDDPTATLQAFWVVVLGAVALAVGGVVGIVDELGIGVVVQVFTWSLAYSIVAWVVLGLLANWLGRKVFKEEVTLLSLLRAIGFANTPGVFYIFLVVSGMERLVSGVILLWVLVALIIAFRNTLQVSFLIGFWMSAIGLFITFNIRDLFSNVLLRG